MGIDARCMIRMRDDSIVRPADTEPWPDDRHLVYGPWEGRHWVRYYAPGYPRGPWPEIRAVLTRFLNDPGVEHVYYLGDSGSPVGEWWEQMRPLTWEDIELIDRSYV